MKYTYPRKLLLIFPSTARGGVEEYALTIASAAVKEGWAVHVAFPKRSATASLLQDFTAEGVCYHQLEITEVNAEKFQAVITYLFAFARTAYLLLKLKPNVVQVNLPLIHYCLGSIVACGIFKIPTMVVFHLTPYGIPLNRIKLKVAAWARARNQQWIAVSENSRKVVCATYQAPNNEVLCIYNGTKVMPASTNGDREDLTALRCLVRQELGVPETSILALTVGRLHPYKGHSDLIPAIPHLIKEFPDIRFVWAGDGDLREDLINKVQEYGVEDNVLFLGHRSDVPRLLKSADLFIFPTHCEGHPFALLEAMANGLPIVTSDANGIPEVIQDRVDGLLSRTGDSCDLLETIRAALRNPNHMQEIAQNAQLRVQEFSEQRMLKETLDVFEQLNRKLVIKLAH